MAALSAALSIVLSGTIAGAADLSALGTFVAVEGTWSAALADSMGVDSTLVRSDPTFAADSVAVAMPPDTVAADTLQHPPKKRWNPVRLFVADAWAVIKSPFQMDWRSGLIAVGTAATAAVIYHNDEEILEAVQEAEGPVMEVIRDVGNFLDPLGYHGSTMPFYVGGIILGAWTKVEGVRNFSFEMVESHMIAGGIRNIAEYAVGRKRPYEGEGPYSFESGKGSSMPSGHVSAVFELATVSSHHAKRDWVTVLCFTLASTVAIQRVDTSAHWPSDVFVGAAVGTWVARIIVRQNDARTLRIEPVAGRDGMVGFRLEKRF